MRSLFISCGTSQQILQVNFPIKHKKQNILINEKPCCKMSLEWYFINDMFCSNISKVIYCVLSTHMLLGNAHFLSEICPVVAVTSFWCFLIKYASLKWVLLLICPLAKRLIDLKEAFMAERIYKQWIIFCLITAHARFCTYTPISQNYFTKLYRAKENSTDNKCEKSTLVSIWRFL